MSSVCERSQGSIQNSDLTLVIDLRQCRVYPSGRPCRSFKEWDPGESHLAPRFVSTMRKRGWKCAILANRKAS